MLTRGTRIIVALCVIALSGCASPGGGSLGYTCSVGANVDGTQGWTVTFTNPTSQDITVITYTVLTFSISGQQTGSLDPLDMDFTVAASHSYADKEYWEDPAHAIPPRSRSCRVTDVQTG